MKIQFNNQVESYKQGEIQFNTNKTFTAYPRMSSAYNAKDFKSLKSAKKHIDKYSK